MTRLIWGLPEERFYETGLDRGVLYLGVDPGIPWNGLVSVSESPEGGEIHSYYIDGVKYINRPSSSDFAGTIEAYGAPRQFADYDGMGLIGAGLFIDQQKRKPFSFSYRTRIGSEAAGDSVGYKIHIVYNAMVSTPERKYETLNESITPILFSWPFTTTPMFITGRIPSAHLIVDSRLVNPAKLLILENNLYGDSLIQPHCPTPQEIITILS